MATYSCIGAIHEDVMKMVEKSIAKNRKEKILTAHIQAVRILCGAPDRAP